MGRCNNRRAQERAAQERNVSARARFSKGPPNKKGGRGGRGRGGRGGRDGGRGRGRGGQNNDAVVEKIKNRVQQQRKDLGGISIVKSSKTTNSGNRDANITSLSRKSRHAMDGIDVSKLDSITLSAESVKIVERLLRAYNVWEGDNNDEDEKKSDVEDIIDKQKEEEDTSAQYMHKTSSQYTMTANPGDIDNYDDYGGDYEDEPDYQCRKDDITFNHVDVEDDNVNKDIDESDDDSIDRDVKDNLDDEDTLINSPIYRHLTTHFSFQQQEAILALRASKKRLLVVKQNAKAEEGDNDVDNIDDDKMSKEDEGILLEMSMDWLSLHLKEQDLRRGFRVQKIESKSILGTPSERTLSNDTLQIKAVPHSSISVMPKFTKSQYDKEAKERLVHLRKLNLTTDLIRMGFHSKEVEKVFKLMNIDNLLTSDDSSDDGEFQPLSTCSGALLKHLIACVESDIKEVSLLDQEVAREMEETAVIERDQEKEVLEAIYAEGFQILSNSSNESDDLHYKVEVKPTTPLVHPACNDKCHLYVITRQGYPLTATPMLWFANSTLPPTLLRRISINMNKHTQELVGQAAVFDLMEYLAENVSQWQKEFIDEEAIAEKKITEKAETLDSDDDVIDYYNMTVEEAKKLSRRQRQKYKAAQKSHARDTVLLEKQRIKEEKDRARIEKTKLENSQVSSRMAERVVNKRWEEWVENEGEKAYRKAMNDAFNGGADRDEARKVADIARKDMLIFHGELNEEDNNNEQKVESAGKKSTDVKEDAESVSKLPEESNLNTPQASRSNEATPKTLLFVEKLRRMYQEKAKEKDAGISADSSSELGTLHLANATSKAATDKADSTEAIHVPEPVCAPSPGIETVLKDVLNTQQDQPWLISPEARVPTTEVASKQSPPTADDARKHKMSTALRMELEKKYKVEQPKGKGRHRYKNDKRRGSDGNSNQFQQLLRVRQQLPAYKMRDKLVSAIQNNQITVVSGDTG